MVFSYINPYKQVLIIKQIAVIGSGFSGLAAAWFLLNSNYHVTLFTKNEEASSISAGLLHKYMGLYAKLNPIANEAYAKTIELLNIAQQHSDDLIITNQGLIRVALSEKQVQAYAKCAELYPDVTWLDNCQDLDPHVSAHPGIFISSGLTIDTKRYLNGLQKACENKGLVIEKKTIRHIDELSNFDHVIGAMGADTTFLPPFQNMPIHRLKGQLIEIKWPKSLPPLPYTLVSQIYIAMNHDQTRATIGATYEHTFTNQEPDKKIAIEALLPGAIEIYPGLQGAEILDVKAGIRATTPTRLPIIERISERYSTITGMGSRGLLYHAYFAEKLLKMLF